MIKPEQVKSGFSSHMDGVWRSVAGKKFECRNSGCAGSSNPVIFERAYPAIAVEHGYVKYRFSGDLERHAQCASDEKPKSYMKPEVKSIVKSHLGEGVPP